MMEDDGTGGKNRIIGTAGPQEKCVHDGAVQIVQRSFKLETRASATSHFAAGVWPFASLPLPDEG